VSEKREALAAYLRGHGILHAAPGQPIRHANGAPAPWAFYSWNTTLTAEGLRLTAACILERLAGFKARQIASIGYTGIPLAAACVLQGEGRYTGLCIRDKRKTYVSCRQVEGPFDRSAPVVIVDDSISSGNSLAKAIRAIEAEGGEVEGAIALVQFPYRGGLNWANKAGYRAEALFDIWADLDMARTLDRPAAPFAPKFGEVSAPENLHPAALARFAARIWAATGRAPRPPRRMDRDYDGQGGVFVSFRERADDVRRARGGFWHFDPAAAEPCHDVILATIDTLRMAPERLTPEILPHLKIAVTFCSALERIAPKDLNFGRYAIVAASTAFPAKRGGALPNTQVFISEAEQYHQARVKNAGIAQDEPHDLFRHDVGKFVEPGETWLPYGTPEDRSTAWWRNAALGGLITQRARRVLSGASSAALPAGFLPCRIEGVAVRIYRAGLVGYGLALGEDLDQALQEAAAQAKCGPWNEEVKIVVSILHHPEKIANAAIAHVAFKLRRGLDAVEISLRTGSKILLPGVLTYNNLSREAFVRLAARLAGGEQAADSGQASWRTLHCAEWLDDGSKILPLQFGFPVRGERDMPPADLMRRLGGYIARSLGHDGLPLYALDPATGETQRHGTAARVIHGLMALDLAGAFLGELSWQAAAGAGLRYCLDHVRDGKIELPGYAGGTLADAVLLRALARHGELRRHEAAQALANRLQGLMRPDGRIGRVPKRLDWPEDHEFLPGALLAALADFGGVGDARQQIAWYAHRFAAVPGWGQAGWLPQGMAALYRALPDPEAACLAFAAADWALERQLTHSGAFLEDLCPDEPSFNTGFIAEGVAAAWEIALAARDTARATRYAAAWTAAMRFMTRLIVFPEDVFALHAGEAALGGVRCTQTRSDLRIDQVSHCLHALAAGARLGAGCLQDMPPNLVDAAE
jgi:orotate phosphoribosyltransferase/AMMECR1 domain-containing protein